MRQCSAVLELLAQIEVDLDVILRDPMALLFLVIGLGFFIGKLKIKGFELGPSVGVLFCALYFGHKGYPLPQILGTLGFIFFIYSVGFQSGPRFFPAFKENGLRFVALGTVMIGTAAAMSALMCWVFGLSRGHLVGIMGGSLTTVSGVAAANRLLATEGAVTLPEGTTATQLIQDSTAAFAITSVFGLVGLLALIRAMPRIVGVNLAEEARKLELARKGSRARIDIDDDLRLGPKGPPQRRTYKVSNASAIGKSIGELDVRRTTGAVLAKIHRGTILIDVGAETRLEPGDMVMALGYVPAHQKVRDLLGDEVEDDELVAVNIDTSSVVVTDPKAIGRTIVEAGITNSGCMLFAVRREGVEMPLAPDLRFEKGDQVILAGPRAQVDEVARRIGRPEGSIHETDLLTFAFGIFVGLLLGMIEVHIGDKGGKTGFPLLGTSGGLLLLGLLVGYLRYQHPVFGRVPPAARYLLLELGLLLFMAELGTSAGKTIVSSLQTAGYKIFVAGVVVTLSPLATGWLFGRKVLKFDPLTLMGALTGGMINTPALGIVNKAAGSNIPAVGYAGVYAFATILLTVAAPLVLKL